jgi:hypothetical protein
MTAETPMPRPLRGQPIDVEIPADSEALLADLERSGFSRNAYLEELAKVVIAVARQEQERFANDLARRGEAPDFFAGHWYQDLRHRTACILIRFREGKWWFSALLYEER